MRSRSSTDPDCSQAVLGERQPTSPEHATRRTRIVTQVTASDAKGGSRTSSFEGICTVCGWVGRFSFTGEPRGSVARDFRCGGCSSPLVYQAEAAAILDAYARGKALCLDELVDDRDFRSRAVFYVGHAGPIRSRLKRLDDYAESSFTEGVPLGEAVEGHPKRTNQDHQRLTFPDERFDLIVSSHVLEHVPDPSAALREAFRILKPTGRYIFSVPGGLEHRHSLTRAELRAGELVLHEAARYHHSPEDEPALVYTEFGEDLLDTLEDIGFVAFVDRPHRPIRIARRNLVIVAIKVPRARRWLSALTRRHH
jgi:SAM-dependent methyltransferase